MNRYQGYEAVDFLKDDDFLRWNIFGFEEDNAYWTEVMHAYPGLRPQIEAAIELYKSQVHLNDYALSQEQIEAHHDVFRDRVLQRKKRKALHYWLSAAASVLLFIFVHHIYKSSIEPESGLLEFVHRNLLPADSLSKDIQLIVSVDKLITIEKEEAAIAYELDSIHIIGESITEVGALEYNQLVVPKGRRSRLTLSDGTMLYVNSGTRVIYPNRFFSNTREIYVDGEVFLEVASNKKEPFIVRTSEISVRVLGTKFNVHAYEEDASTQVVLESGSVQVISNENSTKTNLNPSQMYDFKEGNIMVTTVDVDKCISWIHGMLYVEDERLDRLMTKLSRYYGEEIVFDEQIRDQWCTGKVDLKSDLGEVLEGLTFSFPIHVERMGGGYKVSSH